MELISGSKTFLIGEYAVLFGGSAIVLISPPYFKIRIGKGVSKLKGISVHSPAGRFYSLNRSTFAGLSIKFYDPHHHSGGWGASSAQYALLYRLYLKMVRCDFDTTSFLNIYRGFSETNRIFPSGADCLAQYFNQNIFFDSSNNEVCSMEWKFPNLDFIVVKTNIKVFTYEHLMNLSSIDTSKLQYFTLQVKNSFDTNNENLFLENLQNFFRELEDKNLVIPQTSCFVREILKINHVRAAKGCGAMSADTILVVFDKGFRENIIMYVKNILSNVYRQY